MAIGSDQFWADALRALCADKNRDPGAWLSNDYSPKLWRRILCAREEHDLSFLDPPNDEHPPF